VATLSGHGVHAQHNTEQTSERRIFMLSLAALTRMSSKCPIAMVG